MNSTVQYSSDTNAGSDSAVAPLTTTVLRGRDGRDGQPGRDGRDGEQGLTGSRGLPGEWSTPGRVKTPAEMELC